LLGGCPKNRHKLLRLAWVPQLSAKGLRYLQGSHRQGHRENGRRLIPALREASVEQAESPVAVREHWVEREESPVAVREHWVERVESPVAFRAEWVGQEESPVAARVRWVEREESPAAARVVWVEQEESPVALREQRPEFGRFPVRCRAHLAGARRDRRAGLLRCRQFVPLSSRARQLGNRSITSQERRDSEGPLFV